MVKRNIQKDYNVWSLKNSNTPYTTQWSHRDRGKPFNPSTRVCRLCLLEKYYILFEQDGASLNQRDEFFNHCYHKVPQLLMNKKWCNDFEPPMNILCLLVWYLYVTKDPLGTVHVLCSCKFTISFSTSDDWNLVMKQICKVFPGVK